MATGYVLEVRRNTVSMGESLRAPDGGNVARVERTAGESERDSKGCKMMAQPMPNLTIPQLDKRPGLDQACE